jgi:hypothetical protein
MEFLIGWIVCVLIGALIGKYRGRVDSGIIWAAILGPIGWLIVALMEDKRPICRFCGGVVVPGAIKCKNCGSDITPTVAPTKDKPSAAQRVPAVLGTVGLFVCALIFLRAAFRYSWKVGEPYRQTTVGSPVALNSETTPSPHQQPSPETQPLPSPEIQSPPPPPEYVVLNRDVEVSHGIKKIGDLIQKQRAYRNPAKQLYTLTR